MNAFLKKTALIATAGAVGIFILMGIAQQNKTESYNLEHFSIEQNR